MQIGDLPEPPVQRPNHQVLLAQQRIDHQPAPRIAISKQHHQQVVARLLRACQLEDLASHYGSHVLAVHLEVLPVLERVKLAAGDANQTVDPVVRKGVQARRQSSPPPRRKTESVTGSCTRNVVPRAGSESNVDLAPDRLHHRMHHIEPDAAAGDFGDRCRRGEPRQKQELQRFRCARFCGDVGAGEPALHDLAAHLFNVDSPTVVGYADRQLAGAMGRLDAQPADLGFSGRLPLGRAFRSRGPVALRTR